MGVKGVTGCMPDDYSVSPIMGCHLLSSIHKSNLRVCVGERDGSEIACFAFWVCGEEDRPDSGRKLGGRGVEKIQPVSYKSRMCEDRSVSHVKNKREA